MRVRNLRSIPKGIHPRPKNAPKYDPRRSDEAQHDAMILWVAKGVLEKYGFLTYVSAMDKIAGAISLQLVDPDDMPVRHERGWDAAWKALRERQAEEDRERSGTHK